VADQSEPRLLDARMTNFAFEPACSADQAHVETERRVVEQSPHAHPVRELRWGLRIHAYFSLAS
jgi:hypothetical protein